MLTGTTDSPGLIPLNGRTVRLDPVDWATHGPALAPHFSGPGTADIFEFMKLGPFENKADYIAAYQREGKNSALKTMVIIRQSDDAALGTASFMRIRPEHRAAEVGFVTFSQALQRTTEATEAIFLMINHAMTDLAYRRFEWKCNAANEKSKRAALRFGFTYEGTFRQDLITKGKNRDTAWFSIIDGDWPARRTAFQGWLDPQNFDDKGQQKQSLKTFRGLYM